MVTHLENLLVTSQWRGTFGLMSHILLLIDLVVYIITDYKGNLQTFMEAPTLKQTDIGMEQGAYCLNPLISDYLTSLILGSEG